MTDPITEADLLGYVDDQLDIARRIEVEDHLSRHPEAAAQVMADLGMRDALRLACAEPGRPVPLRLREAALRLERALAWRGTASRLRRAAAVALLVGAGWFAHGQVGLGISDSAASTKPPAFVEDALHSHRTARLRARMASQPEAPDYDPAEIARETGIRLPELPREWRVVDAQVFPSREGHSVEVEIEAGDVGRASLFAAQVPVFDVIAPTLARSDGARTVYWQTGQLAYALTAMGSERAVERAATRLSSALP